MKHRCYPESERGLVAIIVAICLIMLLGFGAFAVDVGFLYMKKNELQNAADAAALAGAFALASHPGDLTAVRNITVDYGRHNLTAQDVPLNAITVSDITFFTAPGFSHPNQVEVTVQRTQARGNAVTLFLAQALGFQIANVDATARAEYYQVDEEAGQGCLKPFVVPAKFTWTDLNNNGVCDLWPQNQSEENTITNVQKYDPDTEIGTQVVLKYGNQNNLVPGQYQPVDFPPVNKGDPQKETGGDIYRENIEGCTGSNSIATVAAFDQLLTETGNMVGPTKQGVNYLIDLDRDAHWVGGIMGHIEGSSYPDPLGSPRVALIAVYDPTLPPSPGRDKVTVLQVVGMFIESVANDGTVIGRLTKAPGGGPPCDPSDPDCTESTQVNVRLIRDSTRGG
jgi:Flp pilus assembly protein TadG